MLAQQLLEIIFDESSSSDEEVFLLTATYSEKKKEPLSRIQNYVENVVRLYGDAQFQSHFRMQRVTFEVVLKLIAPKIIVKRARPGRPAIPAEKQLLITLWILGTPDSYRSVSDCFNVGKASAIYCVRNVVAILNQLSNQFITWPTNEGMITSAAAFKAVSGFPGSVARSTDLSVVLLI